MTWVFGCFYHLSGEDFNSLRFVTKWGFRVLGDIFLTNDFLIIAFFCDKKNFLFMTKKYFF